MKQYKVEVPKMLINNGGTADFGDILNENQLIDVKDSLARNYVSLVDGSDSENIENIDVKDSKVVSVESPVVEVKKNK